MNIWWWEAGCSQIWGEQRCEEGFSSPGEPPQGTAEHSHCLQAVRSQSSLLLSAIAFKASSSGPGWILPWEEAGRLWTGEKSATSEYIVARKLELPWQVSLETMGTDPLSTACISPAPSLHWGWAGLPRATPCMRIQSMRQARIRPKCFKACSQENHPSQPSHSSTEPWQNQFTGSFSVLVVPISL